MKKRLTITDVTRMQEGRVCVAGYDQDGKCVRPVLPPPGIHESSLYFQGHPIVFPFAVVEYDFQKQIPEPPHTEDWRYEPTSIQFIKRLDEKQKRKTLDESLSSDVSGIFRAPIITDVGYYVMAGQGACSLGTIRIKQMIKAVYEHTPIADGGTDFNLLIGAATFIRCRLAIWLGVTTMMHNAKQDWLQ